MQKVLQLLRERFENLNLSVICSMLPKAEQTRKQNILREYIVSYLLIDDTNLESHIGPSQCHIHVQAHVITLCPQIQKWGDLSR